MLIADTSSPLGNSSCRVLVGLASPLLSCLAFCLSLRFVRGLHGKRARLLGGVHLAPVLGLL